MDTHNSSKPWRTCLDSLLVRTNLTCFFIEVKDLSVGFECKEVTFAGEYSEREGYKGSEHAPTYEDKDGDLMLVGDVPWE